VLLCSPIFSAHTIKPLFNPQHPSNAFKRLLSMRGLWEL
jgi:flagellar biosynthetic protein FlhB